MIDRPIGFVLAVFITACFLFFYYSNDILNADHLAYGIYGDGYKNFYTLAYYVKYDTGFHFSGMNFPYGENILFTDNQPFISFLLSYIGKIFPGILNHLHGIISLLLFLSMLGCSGVLYLLLTEFNVSVLLAAVLSSFITLMNPQWDHFLGLYSLAYSIYFPLLLLITFKMLTTTRKIFYCSLGIILITIFSFIHLYNLSFSLFFLSSLFIIFLCFHLKDTRKHLPDIVGLIAMAILPVIAVKMSLFLTDFVNDRPNAPWGFFEGATRLYYLFLHPNSFLYHFIKSHFPQSTEHLIFGYDAKCFLGIATLTLTVSYLILLFKNNFSPKRPLSDNERVLFLFFLSSVPVLLFAMTIPFKYDFFRPLYDNLPSALKQFRAAARFSWIFYYTASLVSAITLQVIFRKISEVNKTGSYIFLALSLFIWFIDMNTTSNYQKENFKTFSYTVDEKKNINIIREKLLKSGLNFSNFQAILPLPFYSIGSEKLSISSSANFESMQLSLGSGLPIVCGQLSRTSISQSLKIVNLLSDPYIKKTILDDYPNKKPLLLIALNSNLSRNEKALIDKAEFLFKENDVSYYHLSLSSLSDSTNKLKHFVKDNFSFFKDHSGYFSDTEISTIVYDTIETQNNRNSTLKKFSEYVSLYYDTLPNAHSQTEYEFSIWLYTSPKTEGMPIISLKQLDSTGNTLISTNAVFGKHSTNTYGNWVKVDVCFTLTDRRNIILVEGDDKSGVYKQLMIRPLSTNVITHFENDSSFHFNNYPIQ